MPTPILPPELAAELSPATVLVRGGTERSAYDETSEALFMTSGFVYGTAAEAEAAFKTDGSRFVYSRYRNPTVAMFEERLRLIEGAEACRATASGMAAVFAALLCKLRAGQRVVASRALFGSCHYIVSELLPRYGVETVQVDGRDLSAWEEALAPGAAVTFCESPSNPAMEIIDLVEVARLTHRAGGILVVDNVFATPSCRSRWRLVPMSSCTPRPSISTGRAGRSAAPSSPARNTSRRTSGCSIVTPARR